MKKKKCMTVVPLFETGQGFRLDCVPVRIKTDLVRGGCNYTTRCTISHCRSISRSNYVYTRRVRTMLCFFFMKKKNYEYRLSGNVFRVNIDLYLPACIKRSQAIRIEL